MQTILIVEDETPARVHLNYLVSKLLQDADVHAVDSFEQAVQFLANKQPNLILLDINLRGNNGFDLIPYVNPDETNVIFVTANDAFAVRAFEVNAIDYLLKPISEKRLQDAFDKAFDPSKLSQEKEAIIKQLSLEDRLFVQRNKDAFFIHLKDVCTIQSDDYYTFLLDNQGRRFLYRRSLKDWLHYLPEDFFMQIHRSIILNLNQIQRLQNNATGGFDVFVEGSSVPFPMSRRHKKAFLERFEGSL
jgi:two-component system LytT family response regulator